MSRIDNQLYLDDVTRTAQLDLPWERLNNKTILLSGATGMICSFLIDVLMFRNEAFQMGCSILALTRDPEKAVLRATTAWRDAVQFVQCDLNNGIPPISYDVDYVIHAASNTHPVAYATDPIGTIATNIIGTMNMLKFAAEKHAERCLFLSSVEIYGENKGDVEEFQEDYCGYIDCNTLRAGYPEGKRAGETLCQAFIRQMGLDIVIPRLPRIYGPTMLDSDTKAISQFLKKGMNRENIVLKSEGNQLYSYSYVADAVSGILYCLFLGENGEAYNVGDRGSNITLKELAGVIAAYSKKTVVYEIPGETEQAGFSKATKALLDGTKLKRLGWKPRFDILEGITRTLEIMNSTE